jgi:hypothetical protein
METIQQAPSIARATRGLSSEHQSLLAERYNRILPVLYLVLRPSDIACRNRTWPGSKPEGKAATRYLSPPLVRAAHDIIYDYASQMSEEATELWQLFRAYCRHGLIGLLEAFASDNPLVPDVLQECVDFHRLAKHPRVDAGIYIRQVLDQYADALTIPRLPSFVARYAWARDRKLERWFVPESHITEHVSRTTRRVVLGQPYPHKHWCTYSAPLPIACILSQGNPKSVTPWLVWMVDEHTSALMGFRLCTHDPTPADLVLTLRWSIWHFGAPWWPARGAPEVLRGPQHLLVVNDATTRALSYLHVALQPASANDLADDTATYRSWPGDFFGWITHLQERAARSFYSPPWTIGMLRMAVIEWIEETLLPDVAVRATPAALQEDHCSLPWSTGIGAVLLLPSAGMKRVHDGRIEVWNVPYALGEDVILDATMVDVRYDPDDARRIFLVTGSADVTPVHAEAFEHHVPWSELLDNRIFAIQEGAR